MASNLLTIPLLRHLLALAFILLTATATWGITTSAVPDTTCGGYRSTMGCTAGEFTVTPQFSAEVGTPPYCVAGQYFWFKVVVGLSGVNTKRYNIGFYAGQQGNDPTASTPGNICSVAIFPNPTPAQTPWTNLDNNPCGDYEAADKTSIFYTTVDKIKVLCQGDPTTGALLVPYALSYQQSAGTATSCTSAAAGAGEVKNESPSKCNKGTSNVSGNVQVYSAAYIDVTKVTIPANDPQEFSFTATSSDSGAKISALTNPTSWVPSPDDGSGPVDGTYTPSTYAEAGGTVTIGPTTTPSTGVSHDKKARFYINAIPTGKTMTITEAAVDGWETTAAITCTNASAVNSTRTITATLNPGVTSASCTITNTKKPRVRIRKTSNNGTGTFVFSLSSNMTATTDTIMTDSPGSPKEGSTTNYVNNRTQDVVITETTVPSGWPANPVAAVTPCTDANGANSGNGNTPFGSLVDNVLTIPSAKLQPGADIVCSFTNTKPTVQIRKTSTNGAGTFGYTMANLSNGSDAITTTLAGTPVSGLTSIVTAVGSPVTITETAVPTGWPANPVAASCSDTNGEVSGNGAATFGSLAGNVLTIPAANLKPAAQIVCDFTNTRPTVQIRKTSTNGAGTFSYTMANLSNGSDAITTTLAGTPVSGLTSFVTDPTTSATITETAVPTGWPANPVSASCSDTNGAVSGNGAATFGSLAGNVLTIPAANLKPAAQIVCDFNNTRPTVQIRKTSTNGTGTFGYTMANLSNGSDAITTTIAGTPVSGLTSFVTDPTTSTTITETAVPTGWPANPVAASCSDTNGAVSGNGAATFGSLAANVLTIPAANLKPAAQIVCTVTNTYPGQPLLSVVKSTNTGSASPGQTVIYTIQVNNAGDGDGNDVMLTDDLSIYTAFGITTYPSTGTPFNFSDSGSGLSFGTPEYYIPASGWSTTVPNDDGGGFNNSVTRWRILMNGSIVPGGGFSLNYRTKVK